MKKTGNIKVDDYGHVREKLDWDSLGCIVLLPKSLGADMR